MKINKALLMSLVLMVFVLSACGSNAPATVPPTTAISTESPAEHPIAMPTGAPTEPPSVASTEPSAGPAAKFPTGRFVSVNDGALSHQFNDDGTFAFLIGEAPVVEGTYRTEGDLYVELSNNDSDPACQDHPTYKWSFDGDRLSFSPVDDDTCRPRREAFADTYTLTVNSIPEIMIDAADFSYTAPDSVSSGWVRVILTNSGQEPHHVQFLRLNDGVSMGQFEEALKQGEGPALALVSQVGGVGAVAPGVSAQAVINLPAGEYAILCFIPSAADHAPHFAKGMIKSLTVQEASIATASEPSADLIVRLKDFMFDMPASLAAGPMVIQVVNDGPEPHEFNLMRLVDGKDLQDALQFLSTPDGPPPFVPVGGMNGLDIGLSGYIESDLQPGNYLAICNIPSPKAEGHPHFTLGMVKQFTVAPSETSAFPTGKFVSVNDGAISYEFNQDGAFGYYIGEIKVVDGTYTVDGDLLSVVNPTETDLQCQGSGSYHWYFDGEKLTFAPAGEDTCRPRRESFSDTYTITE
jgi:uncharacterized cupredoxin-like copper-binding protein